MDREGPGTERRRWRRRRGDWEEGGGVRWGEGFDLGLGVRGVSLFLFCFFFSVDRWMDGCGMER